MVHIIGKKNDFNADLDSYLEKRKGTSKSFFDKISLGSKDRSKETVPDVSPTASMVYGEEKKSFWSSLFTKRSRKTSEVLEEEIEASGVSDDEKEQLEEVAEEIDDVEAAEDELEERRQSLLNRFFSGLFGSKKSEKNSNDFEDEIQVADEVPETMDENALLKEQTAQVLKNLHKWLSKLPPEQIEAFRRSPEFEEYKDILKKYGLTR